VLCRMDTSESSSDANWFLHKKTFEQAPTALQPV
jgi:hypothetical protein